MILIFNPWFRISIPGKDPGIAVGDINSDGLDDFFIGGSTSFSGRIFIQEKSGNFVPHILPGNNNYEDMGALFFDADGDGDKDLYVVAGGQDCLRECSFMPTDCMSMMGRAILQLDKNALPDITGMRFTGYSS